MGLLFFFAFVDRFISKNVAFPSLPSKSKKYSYLGRKRFPTHPRKCYSFFDNKKKYFFTFHFYL